MLICISCISPLLFWQSTLDANDIHHTLLHTYGTHANRKTKKKGEGEIHQLQHALAHHGNI